MAKLGLLGNAVARRDKVDTVMAPYTKALLGIANEAGVPFAYSGNKGSKSQELIRTSKINHAVVRALLGK